ncbi:MAG TPA: 50S ribosomal protein L4 [Gemmatimonadales bacterium]|nr:50S ribosomal protein L4 [Gemmatimonadales bacterium]
MTDALRYSPAGAQRDGALTLPETTFDGTVNEAALYRAVTAFRNNQRQGTHKVKSRAEVSGGNQKPWRQKGTGRARQGTTRAPHWRGGGIVFGPTPRDYTTAIPKKLKALARKSALNARAREQNLVVVEQLAFDAPATGRLVALLEKLGAGDQKVLVLTHGLNTNVYLSGRNLPRVEVMPYSDVSAYDLLWSDKVVVEEAALTGVEPEIADEPAEAAPRAKKVTRTAKTTTAGKAKAAKSGKAKAAKSARTAKAAAKAAAKPKKKAAKRGAAKAAKKAAKKPAASKAKKPARRDTRKGGK